HSSAARASACAMDRQLDLRRPDLGHDYSLKGYCRSGHPDETLLGPAVVEDYRDFGSGPMRLTPLLSSTPISAALCGIVKADVFRWTRNSAKFRASNRISPCGP